MPTMTDSGAPRRTLSRRRFLGYAAVVVGALLSATLLTRDAFRRGWHKSDGNPVLGGALGTCFDVSVLGDATGYRMWFSWRPRGSIALTTSPDGVQWGDPEIALAPNPASGWEEIVNRPIVLQANGLYHMWYTGQTSSGSWIGYATSQDGRSWTRSGKDPVLSPTMPWEGVAVMAPHVVWDGGRQVYRMWYSGGQQYEPNAIGHAVSRDGVAWDRDAANPVFAPDHSAAWDGDRVTACHVEPVDGSYAMFYAGFSDEAQAQIGLARSADGVTGWQRHPDNPIIRPGSDPDWDADAIYKPSVVHAGGRWMLWYNGRLGTTEQIGLAIHDGDDLEF